MSDRKLHRVSLLALLVSIPCVSTVYALDIGFEGLLSLEASDNINSVDSPDEEDGSTANGLIGVYGEHRTRSVRAAFSGEIDTEFELADDDGTDDTISRFLGAAEIQITPRAWSWYFGDILGGVRNDNAVQAIDDDDIDRRNVFITGPRFAHDVEGISRTRASASFVSQSEEDEVIESLFTISGRYERDTTPGSFYGIRASNIFTDIPDDLNANIDVAADEDFNRWSTSVFYNRQRGFLQLYGEVGVTRFDTDTESVTGLNGELSAVRALGPQTSLTVRLTRDLNDQTLSTVESLIEGGGDGIGLRPETAGFFSDTELTVAYDYQANLTNFNVGVGLSEIDFRLLATDPSLPLSADGEDQIQAFAFGSASTRFSTRLRGEAGIRYERQEFDNRVDETDSILASAMLAYKLSRSFELEGSIVHDSASGVLTQFSGGVGIEDEVDITENRFTIGIRWAPPSRASRDLTVELNSLLQ